MGAPERGRMAYVALFSEIGMIFLVTTLAGALIGYWADKQLGTLPILATLGLLVGFGIGATGVWRLISRFLATFED
ncbi:MAG: AtpZ/AtpI family protein [Candidatus Limnocylindrales bacterium]|jgi:F0F1-type ATP synthase assembly protein I